MPAPITFVVPGIRTDASTRGGGAAPRPPIGRMKDAVLVTAQRAGGESAVRTTAVPGEDVVVVHLIGGPEFWLHPESARDLLLSQKDPQAARGPGAAAPRADGEVAVPGRLRWRLEESTPARGATRGFLGDVLVRAIHIVTGLAEDKAADFAASKVVGAFDSQVDAGVYHLEPRRLDPLKGRQRSRIAASDGPSLVLIHGTFSQTPGTFGKLWAEHPQAVDLLFKQYGNRVYALDHPTLGASPIANAITLAEAAADNARLHLLTHSRGGLVAEVLARVCDKRDASLATFKGNAATAKELKTLAGIVDRKGLTVDRLVRVACPARGTLLASKRLDAYVSVLKWALELAQVPIAPQLVEFVGEVARRRADPDTLPGLAAQIPDSPLVQWLHSGDSRIKGDLRVVAGDMQGDSVVSWVKTLLSDAFYWTDNDLIVQTRSMYGGAARERTSTFVLDQGGKVSHFNYFSNAQSAAEVVNALTSDSPEGFRVIGPLSWGGSSATGLRAALPVRRAEEAAELPALVILPGILGSNLKVGSDRVWLGWRLVNGFKRLAYDATSATVQPDGPIDVYYDDLAAFFFADHDVLPFGFDWRRPIAAEAARLGVEISAALDARKRSKQPVRIVAHSMGGLVARTMQIVDPKTWNRMMDVEGARMLMLGTPNDGSWAPMQVLSGDDTFGNLLTTVGAPFSGDATRQLIADFPGLLQLQAGLLKDLRKATAWQALARADIEAMRWNTVWHRVPLQLAQLEWGVPTQRVLDEAVKLRRDLDSQRDHDLAAFAHKLLLVVGKAALTPAGYELSDAGVVYLNAPNQGDGRVLQESAVLPGVATWVVDADHGSLPRHMDAFEGYRDLLTRGKTNRLVPLPVTQVARGAGAAATRTFVRSRPARLSIGAPPPQRQTDVLTMPGAVATPPVAPPTAALRITVVNGDLTYTAEPLLIGHYRASRRTGAEAVMDRAIGGALSASLRRGHYPVGPGTNLAFLNVMRNRDNPWQLPRPEAVIVAGLGPEGELRGADLANTVRMAVISFAQRLTEGGTIPTGFSLATTLLGSGGSGITAGQAAQLIAQGVREANEQLADDTDAQPRWPRVDHLKMIELYLDRASEAWNAVQTLAASSPAQYTVTPVINEGIGALRRPAEAGYRGADYDFISALVTKSDQAGDQIVYAVNTKRARSDVRPQPMQVSLIRNLVMTASNNANADTQIGRTLFSLLVPVDLEAFMGSSTDTVLELDQGSAGIPWEVLETPAIGNGDNRPWSIRTKLLRKLRASTPNIAVNGAAADASILVIGDPACDRTTYPRLAGARREAAEVASCLMPEAAPPREGQTLAIASVTSVISGSNPGDVEPDANVVINAVMQQPWRIIHIAGHGEPPTTTGALMDPRGVVLSGGSFLGPREIGALRVMPELVFVNCCHLASSDSALLLTSTNYDRAVFASGVSQALISGGVRCVIAAGWAVDDEAASAFATTFYKKLLAGERFIDAVAAARTEARSCGGNTWAAYQCYGDPDWRFSQHTGDGQRPTSPPGAQECASIASPASLVLALDRIAVESEFQPADPTAQALRMERLRSLEANFSQHWDRGDVAEAFGNAWSKAGRFEEAVACSRLHPRSSERAFMGRPTSASRFSKRRRASRTTNGVRSSRCGSITPRRRRLRALGPRRRRERRVRCITRR